MFEHFSCSMENLRRPRKFLRIATQKAFADFLKLNFPIVSDFPDLRTIDGYGVLNRERRTAQRSYFIIDKKSVIGYKKLVGSGQPLVPNDELLEEIKKMGVN